MTRQPVPVMYRCYDADGRLIYVGSTDRWTLRLGEHRTQSWWFPLADRRETEEHPTLEAARAAESTALQEERPTFNWRDTGRTWLGRRDDWTDADRALYDEFHGEPGASFNVTPPLRRGRPRQPDVWWVAPAPEPERPRRPREPQYQWSFAPRSRRRAS